MDRMTEPAKELLFVSTAQGFGGGEHFAVEFLSELAGRGWSITLVSPPGSPLLSQEVLRPILVRTSDLDLSVKVRSPFRFFVVLLQWIFFLRRTGCPLVYGNSFETLKWIAVAKWLKKNKVVCHLHDSVYSCYATVRARRFSARIDRFFAISESVREAFSAGAGVALSRIALTPNGVPPSTESKKESEAVRAEFNLSATAPLILMVARTDPIKGHEVLLRAIPFVLKRYPDAHFVFTGVQEDSSLEKELVERWKRLIQDLGIGPAVIMEPYRADARRLMRGADLMIVPSTSEGFGRTAIEAMAEETAVIGAQVGGLAEIVQSGENGLLFPSGDSSALAEAILRLLEDPSLRQRLALAGRTCAAKLYSTATMTDRIEAELLQLVG